MFDAVEYLFLLNFTTIHQLFFFSLPYCSVSYQQTSSYAIKIIRWPSKNGVQYWSLIFVNFMIAVFFRHRLLSSLVLLLLMLVFFCSFWKKIHITKKTMIWKFNSPKKIFKEKNSQNKIACFPGFVFSDDQCRFQNCDFFFTPIKNRFKCLKLPLIIYISSCVFFYFFLSFVSFDIIFPIQFIGPLIRSSFEEIQIYDINMFKLTKTTLCYVRRRGAFVIYYSSRQF